MHTPSLWLRRLGREFFWRPPSNTMPTSKAKTASKQRSRRMSKLRSTSRRPRRYQNRSGQRRRRNAPRLCRTYRGTLQAGVAGPEKRERSNALDGTDPTAVGVDPRISPQQTFTYDVPLNDNETGESSIEVTVTMLAERGAIFDIRENVPGVPEELHRFEDVSGYPAYTRTYNFTIEKKRIEQLKNFNSLTPYAKGRLLQTIFVDGIDSLDARTQWYFTRMAPYMSQALNEPQWKE